MIDTTEAIQSLTAQRYPAYKDSGINWLGEIPAHWEVKKVKYVAEINPSISYPRSVETVSFVPMEAVGEHGGLDASIQKPVKEIQKGFTSFKNKDVLIAKITPCFENYKGAVAENLYNGIAYGTTELHVLRAMRSALPYYLFYITQSSSFRILGQGMMYGSGGQKRVSSEFIANLAIPLPPLAEQTRIAEFLDCKTTQIDQAIAQKERLIELLNERRQVLIHRAVTRGLNPNAPMKDSGINWIGEIPAHWDIVRINWLFTEKDETNYPDLPLLVVSINSGVTVRDMDDENRRQMAEDFNVYKRALAGDIAFNKMRMWQGAVGVVPQDGLVSPDYVVARPNALVNSAYYGFLFKTREYLAEFVKHSHGIAWDRNRLYWEDFKSIWALVPPLEEQNQIVNIIRSEDEKISFAIRKIERQIQKLQELKSTLINSAVTGKIKV